MSISIPEGQTLSIRKINGVVITEAERQPRDVAFHYQGTQDGDVIDLSLTSDPALVDADKGHDDVKTGQGMDIICAGQGDDVVYGHKNHDVILGESGNDRLFGNSGNDQLYGGIGDDKVHGMRGNDLLYGGDGSDDLHGGTGHDLLSGGRGHDQLTGGQNNDTFVIADFGISKGFTHDRDVVTDFGTGSDTILAEENAVITVTQLDHDGDGTLDSTLIVQNGGHGLILADYLGDISSDDFIHGNAIEFV